MKSGIELVEILSNCAVLSVKKLACRSSPSRTGIKNKKKMPISRRASFFFFSMPSQALSKINQILNVTLKLNFTFTQYEREFFFSVCKENKVC